VNELTYRLSIVEPATMELQALRATLDDVYEPHERCFHGGLGCDRFLETSHRVRQDPLIAEAEHEKLADGEQ
jgi:hypothetical protein